MFVFSNGRPATFNPIKIPCTRAGTMRYHGRSKSDEPTYSERKREIVTIVNRDKQKGNIWAFHVGNCSGDDKTIHTAPFPEALVNDHIISWSNEGDLVYDPFMGSGTTAKMAIINKRNWIGSEISEEYCKIIERRITTAST